MKAESAVLVGVQRPLTVFGLPAGLLAGLTGAAAMVFGAFVAAGWVATGFAGALGVFAIGCESACKNDPLSGVIGVEK